jgi:hypothetical protein
MPPECASEKERYIMKHFLRVVPHEDEDGSGWRCMMQAPLETDILFAEVHDSAEEASMACWVLSRHIVKASEFLAS